MPEDFRSPLDYEEEEFNFPEELHPISFWAGVEMTTFGDSLNPYAEINIPSIKFNKYETSESQIKYWKEIHESNEKN